VKKPEPRRHDVAGQAAAAAKNRETEVRLGIIHAFQGLAIPFNRWPDFVQAFYTDPHQQIVYDQSMTPPPFQPPEFDRLKQSPKDWAKMADRAWKLHRNRFLEECEGWVREGWDEEIVETRGQRLGKKMLSHAEGRRRGQNTPLKRRYEWAAKYLLKVPIKEIAGADTSTAGRVAREILRLAGWLSGNSPLPRTDQA